MRISTAVNCENSSIIGCTLVSSAVAIGIIGALSFNPKRIKIAGNNVSYVTGFVLFAGVASINCDISQNIVNCTSAAALYGIYLTQPKDCTVIGNLLNVNTAASINSIVFQTAHTNCIATNNIATFAADFQGAAGTSILTGNLTSATYNT